MKELIPTKLFLFNHRLNKALDISNHLINFPIIYKNNEYTFPYELPSVEAYPFLEKYEKRGILFWRDGQILERIKGYEHLLVFTKKLTEEELNFWRWFKLGYLTRHYFVRI